MQTLKRRANPTDVLIKSKRNNISNPYRHSMDNKQLLTWASSRSSDNRRNDQMPCQLSIVAPSFPHTLSSSPAISRSFKHPSLSSIATLVSSPLLFFLVCSSTTSWVRAYVINYNYPTMTTNSNKEIFHLNCGTSPPLTSRAWHDVPFCPPICAEASRCHGTRCNLHGMPESKLDFIIIIIIIVVMRRRGQNPSCMRERQHHKSSSSWGEKEKGICEDSGIPWNCGVVNWR